ncbi:MAG: hypothetical protein ACI9H6_000255 [Patiriisocius sp.]|jgi:hypothetical protein
MLSSILKRLQRSKDDLNPNRAVTTVTGKAATVSGGLGRGAQWKRRSQNGDLAAIRFTRI